MDNNLIQAIKELPDYISNNLKNEDEVIALINKSFEGKDLVPSGLVKDAYKEAFYTDTKIGWKRDWDSSEAKVILTGRAEDYKAVLAQGSNKE